MFLQSEQTDTGRDLRSNGRRSPRIDHDDLDTIIITITLEIGARTLPRLPYRGQRLTCRNNITRNGEMAAWEALEAESRA